MDPFILREKFDAPTGANLSSAALSTSILPGQDLIKIGKEGRARFKRMGEIAERRHHNKMSLLATENATDMSVKFINELEKLSVESQRDPNTGQFNPLLLKNGEEGEFDEILSERLSTIRDSYLTGKDTQDDPFLEKTAALFQSFLMKGTEDSIKLGRIKMIDSYDKIMQHKINNIDQRYDTYADGIGDLSVDLEIQTRNHFVDVNEAFEDIDNLRLHEHEKDTLKKDTADKITGAYPEAMLRRGHWEAAEKFIEEGMKTPFGPDNRFYLNEEHYTTLLNKIHKLQSATPGGLGPQISSLQKNAIKLAMIGDSEGFGEGWAVKARELMTKAGRDQFFFDKFDAELAVSLDFNEASEKLRTSSFSDHAQISIDFYNKHKAGLAGGTYAIDLARDLERLSENLHKEFLTSGAEYVLTNHEDVRKAYIKFNEERDASKKNRLLKKAIELSLETQKRIDPNNKPDILSIAEIEHYNNMFNQEQSESKRIGVDALYANVKKFLDQYGEYAGQALNELKDPGEGRINASGVPKLKAELAIASIYPKRLFMSIMNATNEGKALRNQENMGWKVGSVDLALDTIHAAFEPFSKSMGYATMRDFKKSTMASIALSVTLQTAVQKGTKDPATVVDEVLEGLLDNKWAFHENKMGGFYGAWADIKYLAIPKIDSDGKAYAWENASRALDHIRKNPDILGIEKEFIDEAGGTILFKDAGTFINSGDGSGFRIAFVDKSAGDRITLIGDKVYSWDQFNSENYKEAFNFPSTLGEDIQGKAGELVDMSANKAKAVISSATKEINKLKTMTIPDKIENKTISKHIPKSKQEDISKVEKQELGLLGQAIDYLDSIGEDVGEDVRDFFKERWQAHRSRQQRDRGY